MNLPDGIVRKYIDRHLALLERLANACERVATALTDDARILNAPPGEVVVMPMDPSLPEIVDPWRHNGTMTVLYRHPVDGFMIVARKDDAKIGGYDVRVEGA